MKTSFFEKLEEWQNWLGRWSRCLVILVCGGCVATNPSYIQGVNVGVGIKIPFVEGCQVTLFDYVSGIKILTASNMPFRVTYKECVSNEYFQLIKVQENRETEVDFTPQEEVK